MFLTFELMQSSCEAWLYIAVHTVAEAAAAWQAALKIGVDAWQADLKEGAYVLFSNGRVQPPELHPPLLNGHHRLVDAAVHQPCQGWVGLHQPRHGWV